MKDENEESNEKEESWKAALWKLDKLGIKLLYKLVERDANNWQFWVKVAAGMFLTLAGPAIAIGAYFLLRHWGFFS